MAVIIHAEGKVALVAGLEWRQLFQPGGRQRDAELRDIARENSIARFSVVESEGRTWAGLYAADMDDESASKPGRAALYSLAAVLAHMAGDQMVVAALHLPQQRRIAVVVVEHGAPTIDVVQVPEKAQETVAAIRSGVHGFSGHRLFTNDTKEFPDGEELSLDAFVQAAVPAAKLLRPPLNKRAVLSGAVLAGLVASVIVGGKLYWDEQERIERIRAARAADPVPKYQAELDERITRLGITTDSLSQWTRRIADYPAWSAGWELSSLHCVAGECVSEWERRGGTTEALIGARPGEKLDMSASSADKAVLRWKVEQLRTGGLKTVAEARSKADADLANLSVWQTWANAKVAIQQTGAYTQWPNTGTEVPPEITLKSRAIEARVPFALLGDLLANTPKDVWWREVSMTVDLAGKEQALMVTLKGNSFVR